MKLFFTPIFLIYFGISTVAQEFPYAFSVHNEPFQFLEEATDLTEGELWDDPEFVIPIGFDWTFFNNTINSINLLPPGSQIIGNISSEMTTDLYYPYAADIMNASAGEQVSSIKYALEGTPGNFIFKLEWRNVGFYDEFATSGSFGNTTNFQMWIHENGNVLEYRYGDNTIKSPETIHFYGNPFALIGDEVSLDATSWNALWAIAGDPSNPTLMPMPQDLNDISEEYLLNGEPSSGTVYRFGESPTNIEEKDNFQFTLWPNPASSWIRIWTTEQTDYRIYNMVGQVLQSGQLVNEQTDISIETLPAGVYVFKTSNGDSTSFIVK